MKLKNTVYKTIEIAEDEEYGMVVGNIVMDGDKMLYAEIVDSTIYDHEELKKVRAFLDEVGDVMTTNTFNISKADTEPIINEKCVGCCKVVDVAANLQKELDACQLVIEDLHELSDLYEEELTEKQEIIDKITLQRVNEVETLYNLKAELSAREEDSEVLMKVVDEVEEWGDATSDPSSYTRRTNAVTLDRIAFIVEDYHDAQGGPHNSPTDSRECNAPPDNTSYTVEIDIRCE